MRMPPRAAIVLLERIGITDPALVGDLIEEFRTDGCSRAWFWTQALLAIGSAGVRELSVQPVHVARALVVSWAAAFVLPHRIIVIGAAILDRALLTVFSLGTYIDWDIELFERMLLAFVASACMGYVVARFQPRQRVAVWIVVLMCAFQVIESVPAGVHLIGSWLFQWPFVYHWTFFTILILQASWFIWPAGFIAGAVMGLQRARDWQPLAAERR